MFCGIREHYQVSVLVSTERELGACAPEITQLLVDTIVPDN